MTRRVTLTLLLLILGFGGVTVYRAAERTRAIEAAHPPQGRIVTVAGRDVHVIVEGNGPDLVLIHGAGGNAQDFTHAFTDRLTDRYRVFSVDRPGMGYTDRTDPALSSAFTLDAESPIEQARMLSAATRALGAQNPIVLGHSYGGAVAMAWALEEPAAGIVIVSGATMPWPGPRLRLTDRQPARRAAHQCLGLGSAHPRGAERRLRSRPRQARLL